MPTYKATFIFNSGRQGWTETWYLTEDNRPAAKEKMYELGLARIGLNATTVLLEACRVSDVDVAFDSDYIVFTAPQNEALNTGMPRDLPAVAYLFRADSGALYHRNVYLRGMPDDFIKWTEQGTEANQHPLFLAKRGVWETKIVQLGVRIRAIGKADADVQKIKVTSWSVLDTNVVYNAAGHVYVNGDRVRVSSLEPADNFNPNLTGVARDVVAGVSFTFKGAAPEGLLTGVIPGEGTARRQKTTYQVVTDVYRLRPVSRDTGRAFFVPRGRRKAPRS